MQIIALLSSDLLARLADAIGDAHSLRAVADGIELQRLVRTVDTDLVIVDPTVADGRHVDEIEAAVTEFPSLPVIVYTTVTARAMSLVVRWRRSVFVTWCSTKSTTSPDSCWSSSSACHRFPPSS